MANQKKSNTLAPGNIAPAMQEPEEPILWTDRKRVTIFALPWSFTKYTLTPSRILVEQGLFTRQEDEILLYRIKDISYRQTLSERLSGTGTLRILSNDASLPEVSLLHIRGAREVRRVLSKAVEDCRRENGVRASEVVGNSSVRPPVAAALHDMHP